MTMFRMVFSLLMACHLLAHSAEVGTHVLFDFEEGAEGWKANVFGSGKMWAEAAPDARIGQGAILVRAEDLQGANLISPPIPYGTPWRLARYNRLRFWANAREPMTKGALCFVTDEKEHSTYTIHFVMDKPGWQQHEYPLSRAWNRGKKALDAARVQRVYIQSGNPTAEFALDHIELLEAAREVHLIPDRHVFVTPCKVPPVLDGTLDDPCWQEALPLRDFVRFPTREPATDQTEAWVTYDDTALYIAARLYSSRMDNLHANETARDAPVWRDDCFEVFIDPEHTHTEWYQFVTNPIGSQYDAWLPGGTEGKGIVWDGTWTVKTAKEENAWIVEMKIPFADFGRSPEPGEAWGFNVCREAPSTKELSMWTDTGGRFTRVRGLADLVFVDSEEGLCDIDNVRLEEKEPGKYILRGESRSEQARQVRYEVHIQSPENAVTTAKGTLSLAEGEGTFAFPVEFEAEEEGEAKVRFSLMDVDTERLAAYRAYNFNVRFPAEADLDNLVLVPSPKELTRTTGQFPITAETVIWTGSGKRDGFVGSVIRRELREFYGEAPSIRRHGPHPSENAIMVGHPETCPPLKEALAERGLLERLEELQDEGYLLVVEPARILIAGKDTRGTYYGARTFLQLVAQQTAPGQPPSAPGCTIVDWPDLPFRGYMIFTSGWPQDPHDPEVLKEFIYRQVAGYKYNAIVWQMKAGYRYDSWPRLANRCALSREQVRDVIQFARDHCIELVPNTNILGHANWIVLKYKDLQEDGLPHQLCTRHPQTYPMLFDVLDEMIELFDYPERLHVGLDEVRWKTFNLAEEERCPRCRGVPKWKIYAEHIGRLHEYLQSKGVKEMWMWGDMLVLRHNGGPPFECAKALDEIPKDIVIANWSAEYAKGSSQELTEKGFRVVKANSRQVPVSEQPYVFGNLASFWFRHPWCPMNHSGERGLMLETAYAADFSWSVNRENVSLNQYRRERDLNVLHLAARQAVPVGGTEYLPVDLDKVVNHALVDSEAGDGEGWADLGADQDLSAFPQGELTVGPVTFRGAGRDRDDPRAVYLTADSAGSGTVAINRRVASLALLHTSVFPVDSAVRKTFLNRFLAPNEGVPVVTCRVSYRDGTVLDVPVRIGMEVGNWLPTRDGEYLVRCPYILRLPTEKRRRENPGTADAVVYVFEWPNPNPTVRIESVQFIHSGIEAPYALLALSARPLR